jgi:metal-sulfur cluster biosynthetic enzyme
MYTQEQQNIIDLLETVIDPELYVDIWSMELVREIKILNESSVYIQMTLTTPACPMGPQIMDDIRTTLRPLGYETVDIDLTFDPPWKAPEGLRTMLGI